MMAQELSGKTGIVTGGAQGIGKGVALRLLQAGMRVAIMDTDAEAGAETVAEYAGIGDVMHVVADTSDEAQVAAGIRQIVARWQGVDALVNNAGISTPANAPVDRLLLADWNRVIGTNLTGYFLVVKHAAPALKQARGAIVNIASTRALQSEANSEAYAASKGGVLALTHALAISLGPEVRVNCISPGWIDVSGWRKRRIRRQEQLRAEDHRQHPVGRVGVPGDIAELVLFLLGPSAGFMTGQNIVVDGGMTRKMIYLE